jgi:flagellar L-ring protein precursor FlgH
MIKNSIITTFLLLLVILSFGGCTAKLTDPEINFEPPVYVEQMPAREDKKDFGATGSIFGQGDNPLFSDRKAMRVNDIVTIVISETAKSSNTGAKQLSRSDKTALGGGIFTTGTANTGTDASSALVSTINGLNGVTNAGFNTTTDTTFKGQGSATKDASFTTTVSARIIKVLQNGNYFVSGKREILIDDQKQVIQISGVIRPYDIDQDNRIDSANVSDAKILYKTEGDMDRATKQGWGTKAIQAVWPF